MSNTNENEVLGKDANIPLYKRCFADFDYEIPMDELAPFVDESWHNNACPNLGYEYPEADKDMGGCKLLLWCDFHDPALRDTPCVGNKQFALCVEIEHYFPPNESIEGNWYEVVSGNTLDEIRQAAIEWYINNVGYNVVEDVEASEGKRMTTGRLLEQVGGMYFLHHRLTSEAEIEAAPVQSVPLAIEPDDVPVTDKLLALVRAIHGAKAMYLGESTMAESMGFPVPPDYMLRCRNLFYNDYAEHAAASGLTLNDQTFEAIMRLQISDELRTTDYVKLPQKFAFNPYLGAGMGGIKRIDGGLAPKSPSLSM
jgi:hypothetical protein